MAIISIDAYKGWTVAKLKRHCREMCCALMRDEMIILKLADGDALSPEERDNESSQNGLRGLGATMGTALAIFFILSVLWGMTIGYLCGRADGRDQIRSQLSKR